MKTIFLLVTLNFLFFVCKANIVCKTEKDQKNKLIISLNEKGTAYSKLSFSTQFWGRYTELNPGSKNSAGEEINSEFDFALRRTRFSMYNKLSDKLIFYTQLGFNNLSSVSAKPQIYFHDIWVMFNIIPKICDIGFGLNGWNGISRLSNTSFQKTLTLDNPGINYPTVNRTDINNRQIGIFVKGNIGRLVYRAAMDKPKVYNGVPQNPIAEKSYEISSSDLQYKSYVTWNFFEKEYFNTSYVPMTYLGKKKVCNIGMGVDYCPNSVITVTKDQERLLENKFLMGIDFFLDLPIQEEQNLSIYTVFYHYDFGKNYLRTSGTMNLWNAGRSIEGAGNSEFKIGTGNIMYGSAGYILPKWNNCKGCLQLFYAMSMKKFDAIPVSIYNYDFGANYLIKGHNLKFSVQYSLRPVSDSFQGLEKFNNKGTIIFQSQIVL